MERRGTIQIGTIGFPVTIDMQPKVALPPVDLNAELRKLRTASIPPMTLSADELSRAFKAMFAPLIDWFQNTLKPAVKLIAEAVARALTPIIVEAGRQRSRRRGYTTRSSRVAARSITSARRQPFLSANG